MNRLSLLEGDEELPTRDEPLPGVFGEERGVPGLATVRVAKTAASTACPQVEQKRLFSAISVAHAGHVVMTATPMIAHAITGGL